MRAIAIVLVMVMSAGPALAKNCTKGCACGNTCISCLETCHIDDGGGPDLGAGEIIGITLAVGAVIGAVVFAVMINRDDDEEAPQQRGPTLRDDGRSCYRDDQCRSGRCVNKRCAPAKTSSKGPRCSKDADCRTGRCHRSRCWLKPDGASCKRGYECKSGYCDPEVMLCMPRDDDSSALPAFGVGVGPDGAAVHAVWHF